MLIDEVSVLMAIPIPLPIAEQALGIPEHVTGPLSENPFRSMLTSDTVISIKV